MAWGSTLWKFRPTPSRRSAKFSTTANTNTKNRRKPPRPASRRKSSKSKKSSRPSIDDHDYDVKIKAMRRFFEEGDKVKVTLRFRGREMAHMQLGMQVLQRVKAELTDTVKVESEPRLEGRQMVMVLAPK